MKLEADLHIHTLACGHGYSTVKEIAESAAQVGLKMIAITEHGLAMPGAPHKYYFENLSRIPMDLFGVEILKGVEANIINMHGCLDLPEGLLKRMDIVLAGFHAGTGMDGLSADEYTAAMIAAIRNPYVHVIVHPGNPKFPVDFDRVIMAGKERQKAFELNNSSLSASRLGSAARCSHFSRLIKKYNARVVINSDAHIFTEVGKCRNAINMASINGLDESHVINTNVDRVKEYLYLHRQHLLDSAVLPA